MVSVRPDGTARTGRTEWWNGRAGLPYRGTPALGSALAREDRAVPGGASGCSETAPKQGFHVREAPGGCRRFRARPGYGTEGHRFESCRARFVMCRDMRPRSMGLQSAARVPRQGASCQLDGTASSVQQGGEALSARSAAGWRPSPPTVIRPVDLHDRPDLAVTQPVRARGSVPRIGEPEYRRQVHTLPTRSFLLLEPAKRTLALSATPRVRPTARS